MSGRPPVVALLLGAVLAACSSPPPPAPGGPTTAGGPAARAPAGPPDLVLVGGKVFTGDPARPWAEAVAVQGERVVAVGTTADLRALAPAGSGVPIVALDGRTVVPGFNDAAAHGPTPWRPQRLDVAGDDPTMDDVIGAIRREGLAHPKGTWLLADLGISLHDDPRARRDELDAAAPDHPIWLDDSSGHAALLNTAALRATGVREDAADGPGGAFDRDPRTGRLTGWVRGYARGRLLRVLGDAASDDQVLDAIGRTTQAALELGVTTLQTPSLQVRPERLAALLARADTPLRWRIVDLPLEAFPARPAGGAPPHPRVRRHGVKYLLDGAPIDRGAWLRAPYADRTGWSGRANLAPDGLRAILRAHLDGRAPMLLHAVGDAALAQALAAMVELAPAERWRRRPVRLERADALLPDLVPRVRDLGAIVVPNPVHLLLPRVLERRLGRERVARAQPLRSLLDAGIPLALGSDGPLNPYLGVMAASLHPTNPAEALTREEAVVAYTRGAAIAEGTDADKGTIAPGRLADLAVLDADLFELPAGKLPGIRAWMTIVGGGIAWRAAP